MKTPDIEVGKHLMADIQCDRSDWLTDRHRLTELYREALLSEHVRILGFTDHVFPVTDGLTGVFLLAESHASFHTWPEHNLLCLDIFSCGSMEPSRVLEKMISQIPHSKVESTCIARGVRHSP